MVQGLDIIKIDIAFLTFDLRLENKEATIRLDGTCIASYADLITHKNGRHQFKHHMGIDAYKHYIWYNASLREELYYAGPNTQLRLVHWEIISGNREAFTTDNHLFDAISIIIGPTREHWYCAKRTSNPFRQSFGRTMSGSRTRPALQSIDIEFPYNHSLVDCSVNDLMCRRRRKCSRDTCHKLCDYKQRYLRLIGRPPAGVCPCFTQQQMETIQEEIKSQDIIIIAQPLDQKSIDNCESSESDENNDFILTTSDYKERIITLNKINEELEDTSILRALLSNY